MKRTIRRHCAGMTLIELMVAMVVGLLVTLAAASALVAARQGFATVDAASQLRDNARFATEFIRRLAVQAGYRDLAYAATKRGSAVGLSADPLPHVFGFDNALADRTSLSAGITRPAGTFGDVLVLRFQATESFPGSGIYLLDLAKPAGTAWSLGRNYYKISLPVDNTLSLTQPTGVLNFKATLGAQEEVSKLYVGDLHGKLWKLDFSSVDAADWNMAKLSAVKGSDGQPYPLYVARDATGKVQPISAAPMLIRGESRNAIYVAFGTGKYLEASDRNSTVTNSFYVVNDDGSNEPDGSTTSPASAIAGRGRLQAGTIDSTTGTIDVPVFVWGRPTSDGDTTQRSGWYLDFPSTGERQISGMALAGSTLVFNSLTPDASSTSSTCGAGGGSGREYRLDVDTGDGRSTVSSVGLLGESMAMRIASATTSTKTDSTGRRHRTITTQAISQGTMGLATSGTVTQEEIAGRLSWRQIHNHRDLREP